jgi:Holliday junction DNA helicase RuvA
VGYEVDVPMSTFYNLPATGADVALYTHLAVREDAQPALRFATEAERHAFRQLLKISGVGAPHCAFPCSRGCRFPISATRW